MKFSFIILGFAFLCSNEVSAAQFTVSATVQTAVIIEEKSPMSFGVLSVQTREDYTLASAAGTTHRVTLSPDGVVSAQSADSAVVPVSGASPGKYRIPVMPSSARITLKGPNGSLPVRASANPGQLTCQYESVEDAIADNRVVLENEAFGRSSFFCVDGFHSNQASLFAEGTSRATSGETIELGAVLVTRTPPAGTEASVPTRYSNGAYVGKIELEIAY